jgi:hypothetical protein
VRPPDAEFPLDDPLDPFDPTDPAGPTDPLDDPLELEVDRSVALPEEDDPAGGLRPWAWASSGIPSPTATSTAISV